MTTLSNVARACILRRGVLGTKTMELKNALTVAAVAGLIAAGFTPATAQAEEVFTGKSAGDFMIRARGLLVAPSEDASISTPGVVSSLRVLRTGSKALKIMRILRMFRIFKILKLSNIRLSNAKRGGGRSKGRILFCFIYVILYVYKVNQID